MSPEQATGDKDIGAPTDIYSLGAVLYSMLTGRPPFNASKPTETLVQVIQDEPLVPTKLQPGLDKDLETICMKCLQKSPSERYESAAALADDLQRFIAGEPILARPVGRVERVWRWSKRNPILAGLSMTAASLAIALAVGGPVAAAMINVEKQAAEEAQQQAETNAAQAKQAQLVAQKNEKLAQRNAEAAAIQERNAVDALKELVFRVQRLMKGQPAIQPLRLELLDVARDGLERMEAAGGDHNAQNIIAAGVFRRLGDLNIELGRVLTAKENYEDCLGALTALNEAGELPKPNHNLSTIYDRLGLAASRSGKLEASRAYYQTCLDIRRAWAIDEPDDRFIPQNIADTLGRLGSVAMAQGDLESARTALEESASLRKEFVESDPASEEAQLQWVGTGMLWRCLDFQEGDLEAARNVLEAIIEETEGIAKFSGKPFPIKQNLCLFRTNLGDIQLYGDHAEQAASTYQRVVADCGKLAQTDPNDLRIQAALGNAAYRLGVAERSLDNDQTASESLKQCLEIRRRLYSGEPDNLNLQINLLLAMAHTGELEGADPILSQAEAGVTSEPGLLYLLACSYALLGQAIDQGATPPNEQWKPKDLQQAGLTTIEKSVELGFRRLTDLRLDPDLDPLRESPQFAALLAQIAEDRQATRTESERSKK